MPHLEIPNTWDFNCFGCSPTNDFGLQLRFYLSDEYKGCFAECTIPDHFCGFASFIHGGIIAALLDEVAAWAIISQLLCVGITREITTKYLSPVRANEKIRVEGKIVNYDEKAAVVRSRIISDDGVLLAEADSTWSLPSVSTLAKLAGMDEEHLAKIFERVIHPIQKLQDSASGVMFSE